MKIITKEFLNANPDAVFVFGDNYWRNGKGGAAKLRDCPNSLGFVTKKAPDMEDDSFFSPNEYKDLFIGQYLMLDEMISRSPNKTFYISKLGSGLANKYHIYEEIIEPRLKYLELTHSNVVLL